MITVEIYINRIVITHDGQQRTFVPDSPFSTTRLLVGDFHAAESCLKQALKEMNAFSVFNFSRPKLLIHPKELIEGGLSEIEKRVLMEIGHGAGAGKVEVIIDGKAV